MSSRNDADLCRKIAGWRELMKADPDAISEMFVKRPMFEKKKPRVVMGDDDSIYLTDFQDGELHAVKVM